jgi:hypothetical protein
VRETAAAMPTACMVVQGPQTNIDLSKHAVEPDADGYGARSADGPRCISTRPGTSSAMTRTSSWGNHGLLLGRPNHSTTDTPTTHLGRRGVTWTTSSPSSRRSSSITASGDRRRVASQLRGSLTGDALALARQVAAVLPPVRGGGAPSATVSNPSSGTSATRAACSTGPTNRQ